MIDETTRRRFLIGCGAVLATDVNSLCAAERSTAPEMRVRLKTGPVSSVNVSLPATTRVVLPDTKTELLTLPRGTRTTIRATRTGFRVGDRTLAASRVEFISDAPENFWLGDSRYRGRLRLVRVRGGRFEAINHVSLPDYLASVIDSEMPFEFGEQARIAQAITARSYALFHREENHPLFDVYATTRSQRYLGWQYRTGNDRLLAGESERSRRIVEKTSGLVLTWNRELLCSYFSAVCGGRTRAGGDVFGASAISIPSVRCEYCRPAPLHHWERKNRTVDVHARLTRYLRDRKTTPLGTGWRVANIAGERLRFTLGRRSVDISRADVRRHLFSPLFPSDRFTLLQTATEVRARGRGHGHGVGLCQWGARGLDHEGATATQILRFYYPNASLVRFTY